MDWWTQPDVLAMLLSEKRSESTRKAYDRDIKDFFTKMFGVESFDLRSNDGERGQGLCSNLYISNYLIYLRNNLEHFLFMWLCNLSLLIPCLQ
jgi:hypothetical protein